MRTMLAKWFFLKSVDDGKHSPRFVGNRIERCAKFAAWSRSMTAIDQRLAEDVIQAEVTPSRQMHQRTMDALHEHAFTTNTDRSQRRLPRFAAAAFCMIVVAASLLASSLITSTSNDSMGFATAPESIFGTVPTFDFQQQRDAILISYVQRPLDEEGRAIAHDAQRVGEYLLNRLPRRSIIRPASYTPDQE